MAVSKWLMRKSFDEASAKAAHIKAATKLKEEKNAGLFTQSQEKLRDELGLGNPPANGVKTHCPSCNCGDPIILRGASRPRTRVKLRKSPASHS